MTDRMTHEGFNDASMELFLLMALLMAGSFPEGQRQQFAALRRLKIPGRKIGCRSLSFTSKETGIFTSAGNWEIFRGNWQIPTSKAGSWPWRLGRAGAGSEGPGPGTGRRSRGWPGGGGRRRSGNPPGRGPGPAPASPEGPGPGARGRMAGSSSSALVPGAGHGVYPDPGPMPEGEGRRSSLA